MSDIVERARQSADDCEYTVRSKLLNELASEIELLREKCDGMQASNTEFRNINRELSAEVRGLRAERDNWEAVCSGSLKEQFRLARENEARLKLALEQLDKAAAEIEMHERLRATLADALETLRAEKRELRAEIARLMEAKWQE